MTTTTITDEKILQEVCTYYNVSADQLLKRCRKFNLVAIRGMAMCLMRWNNCTTLHQIAKLMHRTHSTVIHSIDATSDLLDTSGTYREDYRKIYNKIFNQQQTKIN